MTTLETRLGALAQTTLPSQSNLAPLSLAMPLGSEDLGGREAGPRMDTLSASLPHSHLGAHQGVS